MKKTVGFCEFCDSFRDMDRNDNFSYDGKKALFEYLEQYEDDCDVEIELDVIVLCCEYSEYESLEELQKDYSDVESLEDLEEHTQVIYVHGGRLIIQQF